MVNKLKIRIEDIASYSSLPFDLYDQANKIIFRKGEILDSRKLSILCQKDLYKHEESQKSGVSYDFATFVPSIISQKNLSFIINITSELLNQIKSNKKASIEGVFQARDKIIDEVTKKIHTVKDVNSLRMYFEDYYVSHSINVSTLSTAIAIKMNFKDDEIKEITLAGLLHDVGMVKIPKQILNKPDKLTEKEFEIIKLHAPLGYKIVKDEYGLNNNIALAVLDHQERYDGTGYMRGLDKEKISKFAQIISLADVYDAASSNKVYAVAKPPKEVMREILTYSKNFNPRILHTLVHMVNYNTGTLK